MAQSNTVVRSTIMREAIRSAKIKSTRVNGYLEIPERTVKACIRCIEAGAGIVQERAWNANLKYKTAQELRARDIPTHC